MMKNYNNTMFIPYTLYGDFTQTQFDDLKELNNILPPTNNPFAKAWFIIKHDINVFSVQRSDWKRNIGCKTTSDIFTTIKFYTG